MKYTVEVVPLCTYIVWFLSCDNSSMCKKCCCVFAHRYTLDDDSEHPMDHEISLLHKCFPILRNNILSAMCRLLIYDL